MQALIVPWATKLPQRVEALPETLARRCAHYRTWEAGVRVDGAALYAHLSIEHLAPYAELLCAARVVKEELHSTTTAQP